MDKGFIDIGIAKVDTSRLCRRGYSEAIFCECKENNELIKIFKTMKDKGQNIIGTRASKEQYEALKKIIKDVQYDKKARIITLITKEIKRVGNIAICTGGTGDIAVAQEAALTAEFYGSNVSKYYDIGIAGIHRLLDNIDEIKKANVIIAVAGMEGALGGVIAGMVNKPVIAVPTSVGYGASFKGISALLTMLNSCAEGMSVVNIDNGFGAGYNANLINRLIEGKNND